VGFRVKGFVIEGLGFRIEGSEVKAQKSELRI
jgi:hypothetical protein